MQKKTFRAMHFDNMVKMPRRALRLPKRESRHPEIPSPGVLLVFLLRGYEPQKELHEV